MYVEEDWACSVASIFMGQEIALEHASGANQEDRRVDTHPWSDEARRELDSYVMGAGFLDRLSEGVILINFEGKVVDCNAKTCAMLDRTSAQIIGRGLDETDWRFVREDGTPLPREENPIEVTLRTGVGCHETMVGLDAPGKARTWAIVSTIPLAHEDGITGLIATLDDVTILKHEEKSLRLFLEVSRLLTSVEKESVFLQNLCDTLVEVGGYAIARLDRAIDDDKHSVETVHIAEYTKNFAQSDYSWSDSTPDGQGPGGIAMRTHVTQVANDLSIHPGYEPWRKLVADMGIASSIAIPLTLGPSTYVLGLYERYIGAFDEPTVQGLEEIAREIEFGLAHIRSVEETATALNGTISALAHMTETRDPYTAGHQVHVGSLGEEIALRMSIEPKLIALIRQSGELHDVGKIAIPSEILTRPGRLSDLEFELVKRHPIVGSEILSRASLPWPIADVALQHHERMDGSGYPSGLTGDEICLPARIIAVADVVEAMSQHRPYRAALGLDRALDEVSRGAGILFDAEVVSACIHAFEDGFTF